MVTQWFERARFEDHGRAPGKPGVLLGLLGNELRSRVPAPPAPVTPSPTPPSAVTYRLDIVEISREEFQRLANGNNCPYPERQNVYLDSPRNLILGYDWDANDDFVHYHSIATACPVIALNPDDQRIFRLRILSDGTGAPITTVGNSQGRLPHGTYLKFIIRKQ